MRGESLEVKSERLPEGWKCEKIKYIVSLRTSHSLNNKNFIGLENVASWSGELTNHQSDSVPEGETMQVNKRDVLFGKLRPYLAKVYLAENDACCSPEFLVLRANEDKILPHLLKYIFLNHQIIDEINKSTYGTKMPRASWNFIGNLTVSLPSLTSQFSLITFLDRKCAEIDELSALQETMIAELKRYKQSVITEAVTKGLDPNVPMKDSGVECVGKIPIHWNMVLVPFVFYNLDCLREPISAEKRERKNPQYDYYGASGVIDKIDYYNVEDKVLLIGEDGANLRMRNLPLIYKAEGKFWVNNHAHILKPKKDNYDYMCLMLEALDYNDFITGSAQPKLSQENLSKVKVCVPPLSEQQAIADYLDEKCGEIDELIAIKQQKIEALKEYKKSVIFEYVTGKKEVQR